jgi:glutathione S-transferase
MIEVWGRATSSNVQALTWGLAELSLPFRRYDLGHRFGGLDSAPFRHLTPHGKIPVLRDTDGTVVWETGAILRYVCAKYGTAPFWPGTPAERAYVDMWAEWAKVNVAMGFTGPVFWQVVRTPKRDQDPARIAAALAALTGEFEKAERQLQDHDYLTGTALTLADIQFGHILYRYYSIGIDRPALPKLDAYYQRLSARPAYREHVMVSYDELRAES